MSLIMKQAQNGVQQVTGAESQFLGGIISTIGKIGGGIIRGIGTATGLIPQRQPPQFAPVPQQQPPLPPSRQQVPVPGVRGKLERIVPGGRTGMMACPSGFHPNKTSYFLKDGTFVEVGTRCVRNRRRNPLNPRAASRAIGRIESAKKAVRRFDRIEVRCKRCRKIRCEC